MQIVGKITGVSKSFTTNKLRLEIEADMGFTEELERLLHIDKLSISMKQWKPKRSLDANAYSWLLISKLAEAMNSSKEEVYELMLQRYGVTETDEQGAVMISVLSHIDVSKLGIHLALVGKGHVDGKEFNHYRVIKGSSTYDTKEMSQFIEGVIYECKQLGIETLPPAELERMVSAWQGR